MRVILLSSLIILFIGCGKVEKENKDSANDKDAESSIDTAVLGSDIVIDESSFPDEFFRNYVKEEIDTDKDGKLNQKEIMNVEWIHANGITYLEDYDYNKIKSL